MLHGSRGELRSPDAVWCNTHVKNADRSNRRVAGERSSPLHLASVLRGIRIKQYRPTTDAHCASLR